MKHIPDRNDYIYKEIASFKDYELRDCITVELALRNQHVNKLLGEIHEITNRREKPYDSEQYEIDIKLYLANDKYLKKNFFVNCETITLRAREDIDTAILARVSSGNGSLVFDDTLSASFLLTEDNKKIDKNIILEFSRVPLEVPDHLKKTLDIKINTLLPKNELRLQLNKLIEKIYSNQYITTPCEVYDNNFSEYSEKNAPKKLHGDKLADLFFMYDYYKAKKTTNPKETDESIYHFIDNKLLDFYDSSEERIYATTWYKNNKVKMVNLVENAEYKNLITGIQNLDDANSNKTFDLSNYIQI